jgi:hypothetical protein
MIKALQNNRTLLFFWIIGIVSFGIRAYINFSQELLIGNGGYYPLQVRTVLERGELAFTDMPFLFYLDAGLVKLITLFGIAQSDQLILYVVEFIDSISIPLILLPIYQLLKLTKNTKFSYHCVIISIYAVASFYTLQLTSTSQKNALGITFLFFTIAWLIKYLHFNKIKFLLTSILFLILTGLTHFGSFTFALLLGVLFFIFKYRRKALLPISILLLVGAGIIYSFDTVRFERLLSVWKELFSHFPRSDQFISVIIYGTIAILAIRALQKYKSNFSDSEVVIISTLISLLIIVPFPIISPQFTHRLNVFLMIPQVILVLFFLPYITLRSKKVFSSLVGLITLGSLLFFLIIPRPSELNKEQLRDLNKLNRSIPVPDHSVVVSKHNLEFWVAWSLQVNVSQESKFDETLINNYEHIYIINQIKGLENRPGPPKHDNKSSHFDEPQIPLGSILIDSTEYFKLYQFFADSTKIN